jgi:methionine synthase I (cobalamin-dependent)
MPDPLTRLLATRPVLLADGAMGTSLFGLGLESGDSPELWNLLHPERIASVHAGFVQAGADLVLTNSFGANRCRLALHGAAGRVEELNRAAAGIARRPADAAGRPVLVAGSIGPTGEIFQPAGALAFEDGVAAFAEQARALALGGADVLWIETISGREELAAAVAGAAPTGLPIVATMTFDTLGRTMMGLTPEDAIALTRNLAAPLAAFGANCGTGPAELVASVLRLARAALPGEVLVAKGNAGIPEYKDGHIHWGATPGLMADYACLARDAGARIVGGCCGTTAAHLAAMAAALAAVPPGPPPTRELLEARLGALAPVSDQPRPERSRRRSR